jgi:hypothetical protein
MDVTNCRSMEIFRRLGIAEGIREVGECLFVVCLGACFQRLTNV